LFEREVRERLSGSALQILFSRAEVMAEGQRSVRAGAPVFFGSTMLTFDVARLADVVRDDCDARCAQRLAALLRTDPRALARIRTIATRETERLVGAPPADVATELKVRARGTTVFVDVDVEARL
jgi:hypothetical protein